MVIEWTSNIPVWSDTLRPEPSNVSSVIEHVLQANSSDPSGQWKSTTPRRSSSRSVESHTPVVGDSSSLQATRSVEPTSLHRPGSKEQDLQKPVSSSPLILLPRRRMLPTPKPRFSQETPAAENVHTTTSKTKDDEYRSIPELEQNSTSIVHRNNDCTTSTSTSIATKTATTNVTAVKSQVWSAEELGMVGPMAVDFLQRFEIYPPYH